jgi:hypothetical protein
MIFFCKHSLINSSSSFLLLINFSSTPFLRHFLEIVDFIFACQTIDKYYKRGNCFDFWSKLSSCTTLSKQTIQFRQFITRMFFYLALLVLTIYLYWHFVHKRRGLPPGPIPLPIFGNFHEVLREPPGETVYARWRKEYGDVRYAIFIKICKRLRCTHIGWVHCPL